MRAALVAVVALLAAAPALAGIALNSDVTPESIHQTICVPGWTATVRPAVSFTDRIKHALMVQAGLPLAREHEFELDHHVPLALGGHPSSPDNLWLQAWDDHAVDGWSGETSAKVKDKLEVRLQHLVCAGALPLEEAQRCIYDDWRACAMKHPSINTGGKPEGAPQ
jgi:hypothetical protein